MKIIQSNPHLKEQEKIELEKKNAKIERRNSLLKRFGNSIYYVAVMEEFNTIIEAHSVQSILKKKNTNGIRVDVATEQELGRLSLVEMMVRDIMDEFKRKFSNFK